MPVETFIWAPSGKGLSEHAWATAEATGAAWVGNNAQSHISLLRSTVAEELAVPMEQAGVPRAEMQAAVEAALRQWNLPADQDPSSLSTGQTRRVAIAAALLTRPDALVLDCPLDGFDAAAIATLRETLRTFPGPVTVYDRLRSCLADDATIELRLHDGAGDATLEPVEAPSAHVPDLPRHRPGPVILRAQNMRVADRGEGGVGPVNLQVNGGQVTHLAGPNGCGKTTLFQAALGLVRHEGRLDAPRTLGWAPTAMDAAISKKTAREEVALGADEERAAAALEFAGVAEWADTHPLDVPASPRRLVMVAAALVRAPELLMLDEPTVGLDAVGYGQLADLMHRYVDGEYHRMIGAGGAGGAGAAVLWTCHDADFAHAVSDAGIEWGS